MAERARQLLYASKEGVNPLDGWSPSVPQDGEILVPGSSRYFELEKLGEEEIPGT